MFSLEEARGALEWLEHAELIYSMDRRVHIARAIVRDYIGRMYRNDKLHRFQRWASEEQEEFWNRETSKDDGE